MEEKSKEKKYNFNPVLTVGIVGHCPIETLQELKDLVESLPCFQVIFFKTSSEKLWIKEGKNSPGGGDMYDK